MAETINGRKLMIELKRWSKYTGKGEISDQTRLFAALPGRTKGRNAPTETAEGRTRSDLSQVNTGMSQKGDERVHLCNCLPGSNR